MSLEDKDILQMDATIIAGALVLLTVSSIAPGSLITQRILISIASMLIILLGISAFLIIWKNRRDYFILSALGTLVVVMGILMIANLISIFSPAPKSDDSRGTMSNQSNSSMDGEINNSSVTRMQEQAKKT